MTGVERLVGLLHRIEAALDARDLPAAVAAGLELRAEVDALVQAQAAVDGADVRRARELLARCEGQLAGHALELRGERQGLAAARRAGNGYGRR